MHFNRPNVSTLDVREAVDAVNLLDDVLRLPDGLNTELQTHGAPLSSSQALRLMLARAMVERPRLLLIDGTLDALPDDALGEVLSKTHRQGNALEPADRHGTRAGDQGLPASHPAGAVADAAVVRFGKSFRLKRDERGKR